MEAVIAFHAKACRIFAPAAGGVGLLDALTQPANAHTEPVYRQ
jgi:hypothetical protein